VAVEHQHGLLDTNINVRRRRLLVRAMDDEGPATQAAQNSREVRRHQDRRRRE
jgi:hypothetical protein